MIKMKKSAPKFLISDLLRHFSREGFSHVCEASEIDWLVTDGSVDAGTALLLQNEMQIKIAK